MKDKTSPQKNMKVKEKKRNCYTHKVITPFMESSFSVLSFLSCNKNRLSLSGEEAIFNHNSPDTNYDTSSIANMI